METTASRSTNTGNTNDRVLHPYIQSMGTTEEDRQRVLKYCMKDGNFTCNLLSPIDFRTAGKKKEGWGEAVRDAKDVGEAEEALREFA